MLSKIEKKIFSVFILNLVLVSCGLEQDTDQKTTVLIRGRNGTGSGVIIHKDNDIYSVLTAKHVVGIQPGKIDDPYQAITHDQVNHPIKNIRKDPKLDLAIIEFDSPGKKYPVAKLTKSLFENKPVHISGWKDCSQKGYEFNTGKILNIVKSKEEAVTYIKNLNKKVQNQENNDIENYKEDDYQEGYNVKYTNPTIRGMSGAPVFDDKSRVIAIHGKPGLDKENSYDFGSCLPLSENLGNNWGISINKFLSSSLRQSMKLEVED
ncbi:serine protease [Coleofasciculus sp. FACHB-1120]|uniref:S1 family peptidase n=1 Tax=Coleofasciculus sp. FACHB-1120 TaxID=2692783 RepID=UPI0016840DFF|nr:serine protease [Coleofasciculus sp. FACHB-1120]MBD2740637.1 trypsin-like peptidase domain-containing protein [Coleofasciculus sp. FACHB-1120]